MTLRPRFFRLTLVVAVLIAILIATSPDAFAAATIVINNVDAPGEGLNDPTPVEPVGGNPGTTLGQQRMVVFQFAADLWGSLLDSDAEIVVQATFTPLPCTVNSGVLGSAGSVRVLANFPGARFVDTWYQPALANKLAGVDLTPGPADPGLLEPPFNDDMYVMANVDVDSDPQCMGGRGWYYGLDNNAAPAVDLLNVVMHEMAHGLGFANFINELDGTAPGGLPDVYSMYTFDTTTGKHWHEMTDPERAASAANPGRVVWSGPHVTAQSPHVLGPRPVLEVMAPTTIAGIYEVQTATFGPPLDLEGVGGGVLLADDGVGVGTDACEPLVGNYSDAIVLVDRGSCTFSSKTMHAQAAGAVGVVVVNSLPTGLPPMGGDDAAVVIPAVGVSQSDGTTMKSELPGVQALLGLNPGLLAGADDFNNVKLFANSSSTVGSSISHWDLNATPNLLMEPIFHPDLRSGDTVDLTSRLLADVGWDECLNSDFSPDATFGDCDPGVPNQVLNNGCTIKDLIGACYNGTGYDRQCLNRAMGELAADGVLDNNQRHLIRRCVLKQGKKPQNPPRTKDGRGRTRP